MKYDLFIIFKKKSWVWLLLSKQVLSKLVLSKQVLLLLASTNLARFPVPSIGVLEVPFLFSTGLSWYDSATMLLSKTHLCKCFLYCPISSLISLIIGYIMFQ